MKGGGIYESDSGESEGGDMKPLKLTLSAFGSYGGTEIVDFEGSAAAFFSLPEIRGQEKPRSLMPSRFVFLMRPAAENGTGK